MGLASYGWVAALGAALAYTLLEPENGIRAWWLLRAELESADARRAELSGEIAGIEAEIAELRTEPFATERAVREVLGFSRPGELVVRLPRAGLPEGDLTASD